MGKQEGGYSMNILNENLPPIFAKHSRVCLLRGFILLAFGPLGRLSTDSFPGLGTEADIGPNYVGSFWGA